MNILDLYVNRWFHQQHVRAIRRYINKHGLSELFDWERSAIYRVPLPETIDVMITTAGSREGATFERSLLELISLGRRCYILDSAPLALFGKPIAFFVFDDIGSVPSRVLRTDQPLLINHQLFPFFDPTALRQHAVYNVAAIPQLRPAGAPIYATTITGPFPPVDRPTPTTPPTNGPPAAAPAGATLLFYGLCFQNSLAVRPLPPAVPPPSPANPPPPFVGDPLWIQTNNFANIFSRLGFRTWTGLAGSNVSYEPVATANGDTYSDLMSAFKADLSAQTTFCNNTADELVIFVAAHGYGNGTNPTGKIAFHFNPTEGTEEWITHVQLCDSVAQAGAALAGFNAAKTYLIIYSCNSGPLLDDTLPGSLQGMHVITATTTTGLSDANYGPTFQEALDRCDGTWTSLIDWLKYVAGRNRLASPRNGDVKGCRWGVTLATVTHSGGDIGDDWIYDIDIGDDHHNVAEHIVGVGATDTLNLAVYDRFIGPCNLPSGPPAGTVKAGETDVFVKEGSAAIGFPTNACDGTTRPHSVAVNVVDGSITATMTFTFNLTGTCI